MRGLVVGLSLGLGTAGAWTVVRAEEPPADVVSKFIENGHAEVQKNHAVPARKE